ncbi:MAG: glycerate kinase [Elusimicrobiota bacterium]|nr:glycerate kinase [Endomicrobiia bacterium]MDW8055594.1 glycerate kinase [Elusimicrobiota bacterium]
MKILVACNTFKEALDSIKVCNCIKEGLLCSSKKFVITTLPLADGGTGTAKILTKSLDGRFIHKLVSGPLPGQKVKAKYGIVGRGNKKIAIVELAEAAGLRLVPCDKRDPLITTTKGVGELIYDAVVNHNVDEIILGIGDSATIDCGIGALSVLGFGFYDRTGRPVEVNCSGLLKVKQIVKDKNNLFLKKYYGKNIKITIASDVTNRLTGKNGVLMFAKQKGAKESIYHVIANAVSSFRKVVMKHYKVDLDKIPGSGAAGGIGGTLKVLLDAEIKPGFEIISEITKLEEKIRNHDIVITGEGKIDEQTIHGKTVFRVIQLARKYKKPIICIAGWVEPTAKLLYDYGVVGIYSTTMYPTTLQDAIKNTSNSLRSIAESLGRTIAAVC